MSLSHGKLCPRYSSVLFEKWSGATQMSHQNNSSFQLSLCRTRYFKSTFLPYRINNWDKLDPEIRRIDSFVGFQMKLSNFFEIRPLTFENPFSAWYKGRSLAGQENVAWPVQIFYNRSFTFWSLRHMLTTMHCSIIVYIF